MMNSNVETLLTQNLKTVCSTELEPEPEVKKQIEALPEADVKSTCSVAPKRESDSLSEDEDVTHSLNNSPEKQLVH